MTGDDDDDDIEQNGAGLFSKSDQQKRKVPMKILRYILCGVSVLVLLTARATAAGSLTGQWAGLAPDGLVFAPTSGLCSADVALNLTQAGTSLSGDFSVIAQHATGGCVVQSSLIGRELATGQVLPSPLTGTVGDGTLSFNIVIASFRNGVPTRFAAIVASGAFSTSHLTTTGTLIPRRLWNDTNHNGVPDCNVVNPAANGECGPWSSPTGQSITLTAELYTPPAITSVSATPSVLWPPNNKMVSVSVSVSGTGFPQATCQIDSVTSNEASTRPGDIEWIVTGPLTVDLLAQRAGSGDGRVYTITVSCTNAVGSAAQAVMVTVPHDRGR